MRIASFRAETPAGIAMNPDTKVAIPFILTGMDNHILVAHYDNTTKTLEFFNSSGATVLDTPDRQVQQTG